MPVFPRLVGLYEKRGYEIASGLFPPHFGNWRDAAFTWLLRDGKSTTINLGIAQQELYFLECLVSGWRPPNIFIVGNSFGWSTLALALMAPRSRVVALDACFTPDTKAGLVLTNLIAQEEKLNARALRGVSPADVPQVVSEQLGGAIDLAFIDGNHTNEAALADFRAIRPHLRVGSVVLFHDAQTFNLFDGVKREEAEIGWAAQPLHSTPSGMVALFDPKQLPAGVLETLKAFAPTSRAIKALQGELAARKAAKQAKAGQPAAG